MVKPWGTCKVVIAVCVVLQLTSLPARAQTGPCATPIGPDLPDLVVDVVQLGSYLQVSNEKFAPHSCAVTEDAVRTPGPHQLLRFSTATPNVGPVSLFVGDPMQCTALFHMSECHGHLHFNEYTDYRLWTDEGYARWVAERDLTQPSNLGVNATLLAAADGRKELITGRKQGFCLIDSIRYLPTANELPTFTSCSNHQGVSAGWSDRYDYRLDGQWVEIDHLKAGIYILENHVNAEHLFPEQDYTNNTGAVRFRFTPATAKTPAVIEVLGMSGY